MNNLQVQILLALAQLGEEDAGVTQLAGLLRSSKSAVSRACDELENEGLLKRRGRALLPTNPGRRLAEESRVARDGLMALLENGGVPPESAARDSLAILQNCGAETGRLLARQARRARFIERLAKKPGLAMGDYLAGMEAGDYPLPFALFKVDSRQRHALSMANGAFLHPGQLCVGAGGATVRLRHQPVAHTSAFHQLMMQARLKGMAYKSGKRFCGCVVEGDTVVFPADCLTLCCVPHAGLLMGDVVLKVKPNVEEKHMPEKTVLLTVYL